MWKDPKTNGQKPYCASPLYSRYLTACTAICVMADLMYFYIWSLVSLCYILWFQKIWEELRWYCILRLTQSDEFLDVMSFTKNSGNHLCLALLTDEVFSWNAACGLFEFKHIIFSHSTYVLVVSYLMAVTSLESVPNCTVGWFCCKFVSHVVSDAKKHNSTWLVLWKMACQLKLERIQSCVQQTVTILCRQRMALLEL